MYQPSCSLSFPFLPLLLFFLISFPFHEVIHTNTHIYTHTHAHIYMHTWTHIHACMYTYACTHAYPCAHAHTCMQIYTYTCTQADIPTHTHNHGFQGWWSIRLTTLTETMGYRESYTSSCFWFLILWDAVNITFHTESRTLPLYVWRTHALFCAVTGGQFAEMPRPLWVV